MHTALHKPVRASPACGDRPGSQLLCRGAAVTQLQQAKAGVVQKAVVVKGTGQYTVKGSIRKVNEDRAELQVK